MPARRMRRTTRHVHGDGHVHAGGRLLRARRVHVHGVRRARRSRLPATVSITVSEVNDPPVAGRRQRATAGSEPLALDVATLLANDTAGPANEADQTLTVTAVTAGPDTHGTVDARRPARSRTSPTPGSPGRRRSPTRSATTARPPGTPDPLCADGVVTVDGRAGAERAAGRRRRRRSTAVEDTALPITLDRQRPRRRPADVRRGRARRRTGRCRAPRRT